MKLSILTRLVRPILIGSISIGTMIQVGCCGRFDSQTRLTDDAASNWIHNWSGQFDWSETKDWKDVSPSTFPVAEAILGDSRFVALTAKQERELLGNVKEPDSLHGTAFLLRAVGDARRRFPLETFIRKNGDVWVRGGANSRSGVAKERRAVIVWLERAPTDAFVTFVVGK